MMMVFFSSLFYEFYLFFACKLLQMKKLFDYCRFNLPEDGIAIMDGIDEGKFVSLFLICIMERVLKIMFKMLSLWR